MINVIVEENRMKNFFINDVQICCLINTGSGVCVIEVWRV